jgi:16S rRNA (cytosine967-C5)-methyltransferase
MLGLAGEYPELATLFDGSPHGPKPIAEGEEVAAASLIPEWLEAELSPLNGTGELPALLDRAPLDLRVNIASTTCEAMLEAFEGAIPTPLSPWGIRLPPDSKVDQDLNYLTGLVEVQDEGSQLIALACDPRPGMKIVDLCAGAGGKSLALAAAAPKAEILACDTNRARLAKLPRRAERAGAKINVRLLDGGREVEQMADWHGQANLVLVDAPCSGSGTWRRNPEGRWRLTPERLRRVAELQARLLDIAAPLVAPEGTLVYAVCSILEREGAAQIAGFLGRHSSWSVQDVPGSFGRKDGAGRLLTPGHDGTDGFFVARLARS